MEATARKNAGVNVEQLRRSLKDQWLNYYEQNRQWIARLEVWVNCEGQRRPSSGFILATLAALEPQLGQLLPLIVDLSSNPDRIVLALGLNFSPDDALAAIAQQETLKTAKSRPDDPVRLLPAASNKLDLPASRPVNYAKIDEACRGSRDDWE